MRIAKRHPWRVSIKKAVAIQQRLCRDIQLKPLRRMPRLIAAADAAFQKGTAVGAVVVMRYPRLEVLETITKQRPLDFPYIPGLLTFREGPVLLECFRCLKRTPDVLMFDGQGIAHFRRMGLATHLGILLDKPSIGCAKSRLTGTFKPVGTPKGSFSFIKDQEGKTVGAVLRTRDHVKPVFVSPGHKIDLRDSLAIILRCASQYRIPEPLRLAHHLASRADF